MLATCSATSMAAPHAMYRVGLDTDSPPRSPLCVAFYSESSLDLLRSKSSLAYRLKRAWLRFAIADTRRVSPALSEALSTPLASAPTDQGRGGGQSSSGPDQPSCRAERSPSPS